MKGVAAISDEPLLVALQAGVPIAPRPFAVLGERLGYSEEEVLDHLRHLFESGVARRFGAVFDSCRLGYASTLCAADIPVADLEAAVARITPHPGITHCYQRQGHPNLWFTVTAPANALESELSRIGKALGAWEVLNLPALQRFKIEAVFGRKADAGGPAASAGQGVCKQAAAPGEREKEIIRRLQGSLPVQADPFGVVARQLGMDPGEFLEGLRLWQAEGMVRRVALVVYHRKAGFHANSMCAWRVAPEAVATAGGRLARQPNVTHCYERPPVAVFPYNLYAMIHGRAQEEILHLFKSLEAAACLSGGVMMGTVREFKKTSPLFFHESEVTLGVPPS